MIDDIFNFNKTMYYFVNDFLSHLKKLDPENFAAAYYDFLTNPMAYKMIANPIMNEYMSYTSADFLEMNMIPKEITDGCGEYVIAEYYHVDRLQSFLKVDFLKGLMAGHHIRRCEHCGRFFLMTKGYKTRYCDKAAPENPRFTCNQMAYRTVRNISHIGAVLTGLCEAIREKLLMKNKNLFFCDKQKNCTIEQ